MDIKEKEIIKRLDSYISSLSKKFNHKTYGIYGFYFIPSHAKELPLNIFFHSFLIGKIYKNNVVLRKYNKNAFKGEKYKFDILVIILERHYNNITYGQN